MCKPDSLFYLGINHSANATLWFKNIAMGEGKIRTLMKTAAHKANIKGKKLTYHSGRRTAINRLLEENVPLTAIQQHSGHKSIQSLYNHSKNSLKRQHEMSNILAGGMNTSGSNTNINISSEPSSMDDNTTHMTSTVSTRPPTSSNNNISDKENIQPSGYKHSEFNNFFPHGTIINGGNFNFNYGLPTMQHKETEKRRKGQRIIYSDSESD